MLYTSHSHSCYDCCYCNVDFVLFPNATSHNNSLLSQIHYSTIKLLNITCTLVATSVILCNLECITWNFHSCLNEEISRNSPSCPMVHKAWKGMWKEWEFCSCPLIDNANVQLDMQNMLFKYLRGQFRKCIIIYIQ